MTNIKHRVERLERVSVGTSRIFVIKGPDGYEIGQAEVELGIQAGDDDLTIYMREFSNDRSRPVLLQFGPLGETRNRGISGREEDIYEPASPHWGPMFPNLAD